MYTAAASQTTTTTTADLRGVEEEEFIVKEMPLNATALLSYRSAPSSFFADLMHEIEPSGCQDLFTADDTESMIATFMDSTTDLQFQAKVKPEAPDECPWRLNEDNGHLTLPSRTVGFQQNQSVPDQFEGSMAAGRGGFHAVKSDGGNYSSLIRHSSSPAGFFTSLSFGNEKADGNFNGNTGEKNQPIGRTRQVSFTSRFIPQNVEESTKDSNREIHLLEESSNISHGYHNPEGFQSDSWIIPSSITGMKRRREGNDVNQNGNFHNSTHHETLPEWLQFQQDFVPCKLRARRGFATHPRSIAERTRRTRISDRMKKLQDLFPNMEKTSISDMLDLAVQHIKNLQKHVEMLTDNQSRCTCSIRQA